MALAAGISGNGGVGGGRQDIGFFAQHREMTPYPLEIDLAS